MNIFKTPHIQYKLAIGSSNQKQLPVQADQTILKIHGCYLENVKLGKNKSCRLASPFSLFSKTTTSLASSLKITLPYPSKLIDKISQIGSRKNLNHPLQEFTRSLSIQAKKRLSPPPPATSTTSLENVADKAFVSSQFSAEIIEIIDENEEFKTIRLKRPEGWKFQPGQYLEIRAEGSSSTKPLVLAIASAMDSDYIEITAKPSIDTSHPNFCLNSAVGDYLTITGPLGSHFPMELITPDTPVFVLGGGSGLTALKSIMESLPTNADAKMIYSSKTIKELIYRKQIEQWKSAGHTISLTQEISVDYVQGRITEHLKKEQLNPGALFFICGPKELVLQTAKELVNLGVPRESIYGSLPSTKNGGPVYRGDHPKMAF